MGYIVIMRKSAVLFLFLFSITLILLSCEDIFHQTTAFLEEVIANQNIPEPKRIFIGGDFSYDWNGTERDAFIALNGQGNTDGDFNSGNLGIETGSATGTKLGVADMVINDKYIYVAGNFMGYDDTDTDVADMEFKNVLRFNRDGTIDSGFKPFLSATGNPQVYSIALLKDNSIVVGGDFPGLYSYYDLIRLNETGTASISSFPLFADTSPNVQTLEIIFDNGLLMVGGTIQSSLGGETVNNLTSIDVSVLGSEYANPEIPASFVTAGSTVITDFAVYNNYIFVSGYDNTDTAFVLKYEFNDSTFVEDTNFKSNLVSGASLASSDRIKVITASKDGSLYIGGDFDWTDSDGFFHDSILKLRMDGTVDSTFKVQIRDDFTYFPIVNAIEIQANKKLLVGGYFDHVNNTKQDVEARGIIRLSQYGEIDNEFDRYALNMYSNVYAIAIDEE